MFQVIVNNMNWWKADRKYEIIVQLQANLHVSKLLKLVEEKTSFRSQERSGIA